MVCMVRKRLLTATIVLSILTIAMLMWNVSLATSIPYPDWSSSSTDFDITEVNPNPIIHYKATEISRPITYWTLTEPIDPYILHTISTWDTWIPCRENETIFLQQVEEHGGVWKIKYQECYYEIEALWSVAPHPTPDRYADGYFTVLHLIPHTTEHTVSSVLLAGLWVAFGIVAWKKKL